MNDLEACSTAKVLLLLLSETVSEQVAPALHVYDKSKLTSPPAGNAASHTPVVALVFTA